MKVIVAEAEPLSLRMLEHTLSGWGYRVVAGGTETEVYELLSRNDEPALAIISWQEPDMDGPDLCRRVRANGREPYLYIILLTERPDTGDVVTGLKSGADALVTRPFDEDELHARLKAGERIVSLQSGLIASRDAMRALATCDSLTRLPTRGAILNSLSKEMNRARRDGTPLAVIMADLDYFKRVNDSRGHDVGDAVLKEVASRMLSTLRDYESVGRFGGEEFLLILPGADGTAGTAVAERVRTAIAASPIETDGAGVPIRCSLGVAWTCGGRRLAPLDLVRAADAALYEAKGNGRNRVETVEAGRVEVA